MNKTRQQFLLRWLKQQRHFGGRWLRISVMTGLFSALILILQAVILAQLLDNFISRQQAAGHFPGLLLALAGCFILRALLHYLREIAGFQAAAAIRTAIRQQVTDQLERQGPVTVAQQPVGSWSTLLQEQIDNMQDYYARYLPQMTLAGAIPLMILLVLTPLNWAAGLILFCTAPLIPLFMAMVGMGAAEANRRNFQALARLSGDFLDRLRGLDTLRLFDRGAAEQRAIGQTTEQFRLRTMEVLRLAFLSSAVLEFFAALSIAVVAVYFGFSYLGELHFGDYHRGVTLFAGFLVLILAPEFFQPLRDLGNFYHAKAQAIGAADVLETFLSDSPAAVSDSDAAQPQWHGAFSIVAADLVVLSPTGAALSDKLNFVLPQGKRVALVGMSGAGKTSLMNTLLGFLPYQGSLTVNGVELRDIVPDGWYQQIAWLGQNPKLPADTVRDNILFGRQATEQQLQRAISMSGVSDVMSRLPQGLDTPVGEHASALSVGQAQRVAVARALLLPCSLLLLDEPAASLDKQSEQQVTAALQQASQQQTTLMITHQADLLQDWDEIWVMEQGKLVQQGHWRALTAIPGPFGELLRQRHGEITE
ncbi:heme ABC transporter permease/ATP-binding protein CydD [Tatumella saanichensis]|uniref:heme ABC transporter permease/ATP-binding protein CydD n=1 Tax=Tatumella saanichensis TaxID=480813 RepID=UPI0004A3383B|nr:cysteine/glutathione ABC transporter permease/ATP-binding protein CydD [Tatumella saanichensis]